MIFGHESANQQQGFPQIFTLREPLLTTYSTLAPLKTLENAVLKVCKEQAKQQFYL